MGEGQAKVFSDDSLYFLLVETPWLCYSIVIPTVFVPGPMDPQANDPSFYSELWPRIIVQPPIW